MFDFASVSDLEERWRPLTPAEKSRAEVLLEDASAQVRVEAPGIDERITIQEGATAPELDPIIPRRVVAEMVKRAMLASPDQPALANYQQTSGPFSQSGTFVNPTGDLYLTKTERRLLGVGRPRAFTIDAGPTVADVPPWLAWME